LPALSAALRLNRLFFVRVIRAFAYAQAKPVCTATVKRIGLVAAYKLKVVKFRRLSSNYDKGQPRHNREIAQTLYRRIENLERER
jgi:hypothetical protein